MLLIPVLIVNQEMVARLGAVTGVGHARLILERFGRSLAAFSVGNLMLLNGLIIVTEFIGVALAGSYFGLPRWVSVTCAAALLVGFTVSGSYRRWERWMYVLIAVNAVVIPLILTAHVKVVPAAQRAGSRAARRAECACPAAGHRHRGDHRRTVAAVLPAVHRGGQADHPAVDRL